MYKNLFFDFDGTLFNGYPRIIAALRKTFMDKRNEDISYDDLFIDCMVSVRYLLEKYKMSQEEIDYYNDLTTNDTSIPAITPFVGTKKLLKELTERGINCFIYTNRGSSTYELVNKYGLDKYFKDYIIHANKPDSTLLNEMIRKYDLKKEECLIVGDREVDLDGAIAAGLDSFSINDYKVETKATYQGEDFKELKKIVLSPKIKGVIFDLDGVLISTDDLHYNAWKRIAEDENIYFDRVINNELRGISRVDSLEVILRRRNREYTEEEKKELLRRKGKYYREELDKISSTFVPEETKETIRRLKENNIRVAVGSSSLNGGYILKKVGLYDEFEIVVDGTMITKSKPDPEVFLSAAEGLGLDPSECMIVEDATAGIEAGNEGGFISVGMSFVKNYNKTNIKIDSLIEVVDAVNKVNSIVE